MDLGEYDWFPSHFLILIYNNLLTCAIGLNIVKICNTECYKHI